MNVKKAMYDSDTNLQTLKDILRAFRDERDWEQFHTPKDLAEAIAIEAGELLENFLWKQNAQIQAEWASNKEFQADVRHELADVMILCIQMSLTLHLDLTATVLEKLELVKKKYPVAKAKGNAKKYTQLRSDHGKTY